MTDAEQALLRVIEEGVSLSADALAKVSRTAWTTSSVSIDAAGVDKMRGRLAGDEAEHYGALLSVPGAVFAMLLPKASGLELSKAFLGERAIRPGFRLPKEQDCVAEIANVVVHTVANSLADACGDAFMLSAPQMVVGRKVDLLDLALAELRTTGENYAVMSYVHMSSEELSSDCTVLLFMTPSFRGRLLKALA
ncbi:MAG: hypothetical protein SF051_09460 [Elusimicrobiota bacterium]|nr:hypothetical protein [Elusimicrobiota bacterium]